MSTPDAAVEAAARGMFAEEQCDRMQKLDVESNWRGRLDDRDRAEYRRLTRAALEAALPILLAPILALHPKSCEMMGSELCEWGDECTVLVCGPCGEDWPCPTVKALQ